MSILTAKIVFADETTSKIDGSPQIALKCKPTTGEPDFRVWVAATHKDQASLKPGGMILADVENGKAKYVGLAPDDAAQPAASPSAPQQPAKEPVTLEQVTATWVAVFNNLKSTYGESLNGDELVRATTTVFIQACQVNAYKPKE